MARRFLYVVDENGDEIAGTRRDITDIDGDWRACHRAEGELRRLIGEGCEVVDVVVKSLSRRRYDGREDLLRARETMRREDQKKGAQAGA